MSTEMIFTPPSPTLLPGVPDSSLSDSVIPHEMKVLAYAFQQKNGAPISTNLVTILITLAVAFGGDIMVESPHNGTLPLNLFALIGSGTGEGKSRVLHTVMEPVRAHESNIQIMNKLYQDKFYVEQKKWRAKDRSLNRALEKAVDENIESKVSRIEDKLLEHKQEEPNRPTPLKKIITDVSLRGLRDALMAGDGESLALANSDSSRFIRDMLLKNAPEFCSAWSGEPLHIVKGGIEIHADNPRLSMLIMAQPAMIEEFFEQDHVFRSSGLGARFLTFFPDSLVGQRLRIPEEPSELYQKALENWHDKITAQLENSRLRRVSLGSSTPEIIRLTPEGKKFLRDNGARLDAILGNQNSELADVSDVAFRIIEQSCKIAALFELSVDSSSREIKPHNVELAFNLMIDHINSYKKICSPDNPKKTDINKANKIHNFLISGKYNEWFALPNQPYNVYGIRMEIYQRCGPIRNKKEYVEPLRLLESRGIIMILECPVVIYNRQVLRKVIILKDQNRWQQPTQITPYQPGVTPAVNAGPGLSAGLYEAKNTFISSQSFSVIDNRQPDHDDRWTGVYQQPKSDA